MQGSRLTTKTVTEAARRTLLKCATCDMHRPQAQAWGCRAMMLTRTRSLSTTYIGRYPSLGAAPRGPSAVFARSGKRPQRKQQTEDGPLGGAPIMRLCGRWRWRSLRGHRAIVKPR